jgi:hypothetical protein
MVTVMRVPGIVEKLMVRAFTLTGQLGAPNMWEAGWETSSMGKAAKNGLMALCL